MNKFFVFLQNYWWDVVDFVVKVCDFLDNWEIDGSVSYEPKDAE